MELESTITNTITSPTSTGPLTVTASGGANSAASASTSSTTSTTLAITSSTSLQPISSQAPVIGEKYYFSKTPISNDVAKAAAETVMAIASSALNASSSKSSSVVTKSESSNSTACPTTNGTPVKNSSNQIVGPPAVSIISIDAKSEQPEIPAPPQSSSLVTKPITFLSIVDSKTKINMPLGTKILDSSGACLEHHPGSSIGSNSVREVIHLDQGPPGAELQAYLQAKAMKAATVRMPIIHEETTSVSGQQHRIGSLTIERAPAPISVISSMPNNQDNQQNSNQHLQGPRNVTMNVMDMPSSLSGSGNNRPEMPSSLTGTGSHQLTSRKSLHLPQDVQLISVGHSQIQAPKPLRNTELSQATSISAASAASNMASPPNKTCQEAIKAENIQEQQNLKEDNSNAGSTGLRIERPTASTPSSTGSITSSSSSSSSAGGKYVCNVCKKDFPTNALLNIHAKIHYFERPYRCDACAVSFRTNGHLQKHKRSSSHFNKVNINATFGEPSTSNPRPFYCGDCKIGFRIHGHLAKHLRSKSHIMKLENSGKLPIGMFAEMERLGTNLNEIDTSDCEASLESLKQMATR